MKIVFVVAAIFGLCVAAWVRADDPFLPGRVFGRVQDTFRGPAIRTGESRQNLTHSANPALIG